MFSSKLLLFCFGAILLDNLPFMKIDIFTLIILHFFVFAGNSLSAILDGTAKLTFLKRGEDYLITMPYAHCKGEELHRVYSKVIVQECTTMETE